MGNVYFDKFMVEFDLSLIQINKLLNDLLYDIVKDMIMSDNIIINMEFILKNYLIEKY